MKSNGNALSLNLNTNMMVQCLCGGIYWACEWFTELTAPKRAEERVTNEIERNELSDIMEVRGNSVSRLNLKCQRIFNCLCTRGGGGGGVLFRRRCDRKYRKWKLNFQKQNLLRLDHFHIVRHTNQMKLPFCCWHMVERVVVVSSLLSSSSSLA